MGSARHARITELFLKACELPSADRGPFLEDACAGDPQLLAEIESLIAQDGRRSGLLDTPGVQQEFQAVLAAQPPAARAEPHPDRIGTYEILRVLGEGGQAIVYEAAQQDPRRKVALKVPRGGAWATTSDIRYFRREIRALAALHHPDIANVFEAGRTDDGRHYFSMELVSGLPLDAYVRERSLPLRDRLALFCRICDAVHYAHRNGVVHRDLKPRNILVDEEGNPKILDFGLVWITNTDVTRVSTYVTSGQIVGSLRYMSPEQAHGKTEEIGDRTDLYSLGVVLYELMTGQPPYEIGDSLPDAVLAICETPPRRPSLVDRNLRGDLETIVLKTLDKTAARRYASTAELADEIRRYLAGDPIAAKPPSIWYLFGKKARKHPAGTVIGAAVVVLVLAALLTTFWMERRRLADARETACHLQRRLEVEPVEGVIGLAQSLGERFPHLPDARLVWAQANFQAARQLDNPNLETQAINTLKGGLERDPSEQAYRLLWAEITVSTDRPGETRAPKGPAGTETRATANDWYLRSLATLDLLTATHRARLALELNPRHQLALRRLAHLCERTGEFDCALRAARELIDSDDRFRWTQFRATIFMKQGRYRKALEDYGFLMANDPLALDGVQVPSGLALAHLCLEDYERAVESYGIAINHLNPRYIAWPRFRRATPLWILGRLDDASSDYRYFRTSMNQALYADARLFLVRHEQARLLDRDGRSAAARELVGKARDELESARGGLEDGSWLAMVFDCLIGVESPEELIAAADPVNPEQVCEGYYYAAEASLLKGETERAQRWFRMCVDTGLVFDPDYFELDPMAEYHLAAWRLRQLRHVADTE